LIFSIADKTPTLKDNFKESYGKSNLKFIEVDKIDAGTYQCIASSPGFPDAVNETKLNVKGKIDAGTYQCIASSPGFPVNETKLSVNSRPVDN